MRSTSSASVSAAETSRAISSSPLIGSSGVSRAGLMRAVGKGSRWSIPSTTIRRKPCSVIWIVSPGRLIRSCTRAATPTRPMNESGFTASSMSPPATTSPTMSPLSSYDRRTARFSGAPICTAIVPSGYTMVERSAINGMVGGSSDLRISSLRWALAIGGGEAGTARRPATGTGHSGRAADVSCAETRMPDAGCRDARSGVLVPNTNPVYL